MLQLLLAPRDTAGGRSEQAHFLEALEVLDQPQYEQPLWISRSGNGLGIFWGWE